MGKKMKVEKEKVNRKWQLSEFKYDEKNGIYASPEQKEHMINYSDGSKIENYILITVKNAKDISDDSSELMHAVKDWPSYYHLGMGRSNVLKSLELSANANILEFGSGCGTLTRYLGENFKLVDAAEGSSLRAQITRERCRDLKNVRVFCSNVKYVKFNPVYDVVTMIGFLEYAPIYFLDQQNAKESCLTLLKLAKTALKKFGILIIAIENKIGIKYWGGAPEDHTGKIFDSIHGYPSIRSPITFSKKEIKDLLKAAGFSHISFYYCFPDYKFASTIISDIGYEKDFYLHNWIEVPFVSYNIPRIYTFHEGLAIKTLSKAGLLRQFANSFLVVASQGISNKIRKPDWIVKRFSVNRRKVFRCITTAKITSKLYIEKKRLMGSNKCYMVKDKNIKIKHKIANSPWHEGDLMIFDIFEVLFESDFKSKLLELLKIYYQELINQYYTGVDDEEGYPLLKGNSIDFIFRNIMRTKKKLFCIDNEWIVEGHIPADFVMHRSIMYDIIISQEPWITKKIRDTDKFIIELMRTFFLNYGNSRNDKNKLLEESFQNLVTAKGDLNEVILPQKLKFLRKRMIRNLTKKVWNNVPKNVKVKMKTLLSKMM